MKLNLFRLFMVGIDALLMVNKIFTIERTYVNNDFKHRAVSRYLMRKLKSRGWDFTEEKGYGFSDDDVDKIISGAVWFLKLTYRCIRGEKC